MGGPTFQNSQHTKQKQKESHPIHHHLLTQNKRIIGVPEGSSLGLRFTCINNLYNT